MIMKGLVMLGERGDLIRINIFNPLVLLYAYCINSILTMCMIG